MRASRSRKTARGPMAEEGCMLMVNSYIHFNRMIKKYDLDAFVISGPGHGAPGLISNFYLEGVYSETYPNKSEDIEGMQRFFKQFSFPGGIGSHVRAS